MTHDQQQEAIAVLAAHSVPRDRCTVSAAGVAGYAGRTAMAFTLADPWTFRPEHHWNCAIHVDRDRVAMGAGASALSAAAVALDRMRAVRERHVQAVATLAEAFGALTGCDIVTGRPMDRSVAPTAEPSP